VTAYPQLADNKLLNERWCFMIMDKNIADYAGIQPHKVLSGLGIGMGNVFYVCPSTSSARTLWAGRIDGEQLFTTIEAAYAKCVTNRNDVIILSPDSHAVAAMLTVAKSKVHFVGADAAGRHFGQRAKISIGVTTAATDIAAVQVTGTGCSFTGIKFTSSNTVAEGLYAVVEAGEYTLYRNCDFYKSTDLDIAGAAELALNGDSATFKDCTFGSSANAIVGAIIRPIVTCTGGLVSGKKLRDCYFDNCIFWRKCGNAANNFIYGLNATDVERMLYFKDCLFLNHELAAANPDICIEFGAAQTEGTVICKNCTSVNCTLFLALDQNLYIDGAAPTEGTSGIAVESVS